MRRTDNSETFSYLRTRAELFLVFVAFSWAVGFIMMKIAVTHVSVWHVLWIRFAIAGLTLLPFCGRISSIRVDILKVGGLLGGVLFFSFALLISGLKVTTTSNTGFLSGLSVVWVPILLRLFFGHVFSLLTITGVILSFGGTFLISGGEVSGFNLGDWLVIAGSLFIAIHIVAIDRFARDKPPIELTLIQLLTVALLSALASIFNGPLLPDSMTLESSLLVLVTAVLSTAVAFLVQTKYQARTSPTRAAVIFSIEPVLSAGLAWLILCEELSGTALLGGMLVVAGMCAVVSSGDQQEAKSQSI